MNWDAEDLVSDFHNDTKESNIQADLFLVRTEGSFKLTLKDEMENQWMRYLLLVVILGTAVCLIPITKFLLHQRRLFQDLVLR